MGKSLGKGRAGRAAGFSPAARHSLRRARCPGGPGRVLGPQGNARAARAVGVPWGPGRVLRCRRKAGGPALGKLGISNRGAGA
ncbi:hypothetical protein EAH73_06565 [Hymenobacter nivis]|uniref:Uncharacterized protein n=1 Tax=Hymenobacter nivis TaxID=1850093 RepID=A0A502H125_9BACT|nr:hypothetical protein EAH73_06565 [Hymenobacter nivis]